MRVGIVGQKDNDRVRRLAVEMAAALRADGVEVCVDSLTADAIDVAECPVEEMDGCDLVVSIGGDGTFLFAAREVGSVPILGVNLGEVGFLNAVAPEDALDVVRLTVERIRQGDVDTREVPRLRATGVDADWTVGPAMNEVVVQGPQRGHGNGVHVEALVDGATYLDTHADGVMVATPTGSSAYNLSEGGPLVHPHVASLVVTDMSAAEAMPSLAVPLDSDVEIRVTDAEAAYVVGDGRMTRSVEPPTAVHVAADDEPAHLAGPRSDFFEALKKLD